MAGRLRSANGSVDPRISDRREGRGANVKTIPKHFWGLLERLRNYGMYIIEKIIQHNQKAVIFLSPSLFCPHSFWLLILVD